MKKFILILIVTTFSFISYAKSLLNVDIPEVIANAIATKFPGANDIKWNQSDNMYVVSFEVNKTDYKALVDKKGNVGMFKQRMITSELPNTVLSKVSSAYKNQKIKNVEKVIKDGQVYYQMDIVSRKFFAKMVYTEDGEPSTINYWY